MPRGRRHTLYALVTLALIALGALAALIGEIMLGHEPDPAMVRVVLIGGLALGAGALIGLAVLVHRHFRHLERLRGCVVTMAGDPDAVPPRFQFSNETELASFWESLGDLAGRYAAWRARPDMRLRAVLGAVSEPIVVVTDSGQVSLVNGPARSLLGGERVKVGTSVFAALVRRPVIRAIRRARMQGAPLSTELRMVEGLRVQTRVTPLVEHGGAVLSFVAEAVETSAQELEDDLELHDRPPAAEAPDRDTRLDSLPATVIDTETTGLDVKEARIVSVGGIRVHGEQLYRAAMMDRLVRPEVPIPPHSTAVHGITDDMVIDAPAAPTVIAELRRLAGGTVWIGHNIGFDIEVVRRECERNGIDWTPPYALDTLLLSAAAMPDHDDFRLEKLADLFGIEVQGRHTALGDVLVTAQLYQRLLPMLRDLGITTLGGAIELQERRAEIRAAQRREGY
ncbi:DNA polymerase-3 subunit epsilon [Limimonas halophila]|uniref:DNA polymerase-3 subunit epsilon n=1 Tax=Limimonas halophila TaxID=1082479 RepID=A0A1G7LN04_9PROT|nr:3'-5' exonuclease [Limimonas halophila]SDF50400.1 DNA polymerase-3 subunit epsilon [Limimonas halophila]